MDFSSGDDVFTQNVDSSIADLGNALNAIKNLKSDPRCKQKDIACSNFYNDLLGSKDKKNIDIAIHFGYQDSPGLIEDPFDQVNKTAFVEMLTTPCIDSEIKKAPICGFKKINDTQIEKEFMTANGVQKFVINTFDSAFSKEHKKNIGEFKKEQIEKSKLARSQFIDSLAKRDAVFYIGHSRHGGGPDFAPYDWKMNEGVLEEMKKSLIKGSKTGHPKLLGMYSCSSDKHFGDDIKDAIPNSAFISTTRIARFDAVLKAVYSTINSLVLKDCKSEIERKLKAVQNETFGGKLKIKNSSPLFNVKMKDY